ncbi:hypothetical protein A3F00_05030 [Candidatus Daviesbacteria bacterium RIFCSPHIGHO2_12_FULL_37_11]|uniref:Type II secretion system protein n=1 Tax=Candidatus Daviesbacteria bacterium RIFCSPHIGHO2_12_FULL_37_11 TaxID=1797777 RepID=A0A1F5K995_9BACT|nr:MAG: hypothetical protein A2111_03525 [Candidatus Daviesbacteria bacterium GWA1_38_6]OGE37522.1 MAG: hypothetical protein A3F00_05030 [Candidatus Daviesbacteria bacterium RIFCSPHIGHO2_12_FULL_37_11]OGE45899.1 MAG: hypothetical protein A3B39_01700 [Candidatus Daviesbacteria bacterium RIFCSPLOWO2_01_FULL_37_10]
MNGKLKMDNGKLKKKKILNSQFSILNSSAFTIVEVLVVIFVISVMGTIITEIFSRSLRGGNKAQIIAAIKQNGQATLEAMDKTIRNSDEVVCPVITGEGSIFGDTAAVVKDGKYTRFRFKAEATGTNGYIVQDNPLYVPPLAQESFINDICNIDWDDPNSPGAVSITDRNTKTGVSVSYVPATAAIFTRNKKSGFNDTLTISFDLKPGVQAPEAVSGQIDPVTFTTTIQLR